MIIVFQESTSLLMFLSEQTNKMFNKMFRSGNCREGRMRSVGLWLSLVLAAAWTAEAEQQYQCAAEKTETERQRMIIDISHAYRRDMPAFESAEGLGEFVWLGASMKNGSIYNSSVMKMGTHSGTHVDAPGHFFDHYFDQGLDVDTLDLHVLNGPALLVDVPRNSNITAEVMKSLNIPRGVRRVLFRTLNTDRELMWKREFDSSYVGFMEDGAQWLVDNTDIKLVGIDYLSVAAYDDLITSHLAFLKSKEVILVEGLKLDDVDPGLYTLHCLTLRLTGAEGAPIRCILMD